MAVPEVTRVNYYSHQYLGVADFQAQQAYHRDMRRRHNLGPHLWGIVVGLELEAVDGEAGVEVWLSPGMATDGYGREIVVLRRERLDPTLFAGIDEEGYRDVSIAYRERLGSPPSAQLAACDVPDQYARVRETHRLLVALHPTTPELTVDGADVAATDASLPQDASVPFQEFPPDATEWPVRLGSVWWDRQAIAKPPTGDVVDLSDRRYIGLTSARVYAPANAEALLLSKLVSGPIRFETGGAERMRIEASGNIGIATTVPSAPLEIQGDWSSADNRATLHLRGDYPAIRFRGDQKTNNANWLLQLGDVDGGSLEVRRLDPTTLAWSNLLTISPAGHVGIGTGADVPVGPLEVRGDWDGVQGIGAVYVDGDKPTIRFAGGAASGNENWKLHLGGHGPGNIGFYRRDSATTWRGVLTMTPPGRVRIGGPPGITPLGQLEVVGDWDGLNAVGTLRLSGDKPTIFFNGGPSSAGEQWLLHLGSNGASGGGNIEFIRWKNNVPSPVLSVTKDERVGIGATQPASKLHVNGSVTIADQSEIFFQDRGRIRSYDDHHALVFDRHNDRLELREWGDIHLFTGGSLAGPPTEKVTIRRDGSVQIAGVGQAPPIHTELQVGRLGTQGFDADSGYPGWDGGIHTWDVYAEGSVGVGRNGSLDSWMDSSGFHSSGGKHFVIEHPLDPRRSLVHASLEGPELAIFYRGEATLDGGHATVELPPYFEAIARPEARTVTLTAKSVAGEKVSALAASAVEKGSFTVFAIGGENPAQPFFWEVTAVRADLAALEVEPVREVVAGTTTGGGE